MLHLVPLLVLAAPEGSVSFARDIQPILAERCILCHGPDPAVRKAALRLDTQEGLLEVLEPGDAPGSELMARVASLDEGERMPPPDHGEALTPDEVELLRSWIEAGAEWESHWAYAPFRGVTPPEGKNDHPIDRFIAARLATEGLELSPLADRRTLIRRLTLDLWGMVPTPEEVEAFVTDERPNAYERLVDRLLASVHHGERFARHWMDLARYADSHGFTIDSGRSMWPWRDWVVEALAADMPFDRFTIEQLAGDLLPEATLSQRLATGFHRNTQINQEGGAGDEENRIAAVLDRVNTTGAVWLGSTVSCSQCHDHKYDPLRQEEYYRLFAFFDQTADGGVSTGPVVTLANEEEAREVAAFEAEVLRLARTEREAAASARGGLQPWLPTRWIASNGPELRLESDGSLVAVGHNAAFTVYTLDGPAPSMVFDTLRLEVLPDGRLPKGGPGRSGNGNFVLQELRVLVREKASMPWRTLALKSGQADFEQDTTSTGGGVYPAANALGPEGGWAILPQVGEPHVLQVELGEVLQPGAHELRVELYQDRIARHAIGRFRIALGTGEAGGNLVPDAWREAARAVLAQRHSRPSLPTSLVLEEREAARTTRVFERGNFLTPGVVVRPGFPSAWNHFEPSEPRDRLDLARWLVHPENALAHRVTVNRHWQRFFGLGLVETENDFGLRGSRPTHPDLLEWLAQEFVQRGMSLDGLHRLIVTSRTYRQASIHRPEVAERDPRDRWLARQRPLRIEAEAIRDSALRASGLLAMEVGGPPVQPPQPGGMFRFTQSNRRWEADEGADRFRRSLYTRLWRSAPYPFFTTFDAPGPTVTCTRRRPSQTALQALTLANDPMVLELAEGLAQRVLEERNGESARIERAFALCLGRPPLEEEQRVLARLLAAGRGEGLDAPATWTAVARVLFNTGEFVTRP